VLRGGKPVRLTIPLEIAPDTGRDEITIQAPRSPFDGARVVNISPAVADEMHIDSNVEGVAITDIGENTAAANVGFRRSDIIQAVNGQKIGKTADLDRAANQSARVWRIVVLRDGQQINVTLGG
jgi:S1-C subfamily serine protease